MNNDNTCYHDPPDEILESVWMLIEAGETRSASKIIETSHTGSADKRHIEKLVEHGYLSSAGENAYEFTEKGETRAKGIIRRHRLAEQLLVDVFNVRENAAIESDACAFEHFLSPEVTDHICTLLGHPAKCPHGYDIPRGPCCERAQKQIETAVVLLGELAAGETGYSVWRSPTRSRSFFRSSLSSSSYEDHRNHSPVACDPLLGAVRRNNGSAIRRFPGRRARNRSDHRGRVRPGRDGPRETRSGRVVRFHARASPAEDAACGKHPAEDEGEGGLVPQGGAAVLSRRDGRSIHPRQDGRHEHPSQDHRAGRGKIPRPDWRKALRASRRITLPL